MIELKDIKPNESNPRKIQKDRIEKLKDSIKSFEKMMALRPIIVNNEGMILGGNMRFQALKQLGYKSIPDDWVKRADQLTEDEQKEFIIKDNIGFGEWDWDILANEWEPEKLEEWGLELLGSYSDEEIEEEAKQYTKKIKAPDYEPSGVKPDIGDLWCQKKYEELLEEIESSKIKEDEKQFLRVAAMRHIIFNYSRIADFYAHSGKAVQNLMEKSGLVIIDFNKAIENGFVHLTSEIRELYMKDYEDEFLG